MQHPRGWFNVNNQQNNITMVYYKAYSGRGYRIKHFKNLTKGFYLSISTWNFWFDCFISIFSKQPSFGKLSVPKPNSVTSERRTSFFGARYTSSIFQKCDTKFIKKDI